MITTTEAPATGGPLKANTKAQPAQWLPAILTPLAGFNLAWGLVHSLVTSATNVDTGLTSLENDAWTADTLLQLPRGKREVNQDLEETEPVPRAKRFAWLVLPWVISMLQQKPPVTQETKKPQSFAEFCDERYQSQHRPLICPPVMKFDNQSDTNQTVLNRNKRQTWLVPELVLKMMKWLTADMGTNSTLLRTNNATMDSLNSTAIIELVGPLDSHDNEEAYEASEPNYTLDIYILVIVFGLTGIGLSIGIWMVIYAEIRNTLVGLRNQMMENCPRWRNRAPSTSTRNSETSNITMEEIPALETPIKLWRP